MAITPTAAQLAILRLNQTLFGTAAGTTVMAAALPSFTGNIDTDGNNYAQTLINQTPALSILSPAQLFERVVNNISTGNITAADKAPLVAALVAFNNAGLSVGATVNLLSAFLYNNADTLNNVWSSTAKQVKNQTTVATFYTLDQGNVAADSAVLSTVTDNPASVAEAINAISSVQTFVLTTGLDNATANLFIGSQTYYNVDGKGPTLNPGDKLTGTTDRTDNKLLITDLTANVANNNLPAGVTLNNIQIVELDSAANTTAAGLRTRDFASVNELKATTQGAAAVDLYVAGNNKVGTSTNVTVEQRSFAAAAGVLVDGGNNVTVVANGGAGVIVGNQVLKSVPTAQQVATGAVNVTANNTAAGGINVFGGTTVKATITSTSNTGAISIGNTAANTGNTVEGAIANASGDVTVNTAGKGAVTVFGGKNVTITNTTPGGANGAAGAITVGDAAKVTATNLPSGKVTITEAYQVAYDGQTGATHNNKVAGAINVFGGTDVAITSNGGGAINVGSNGGGNAGVNPSGTVAITATGIDNAGNAAVTVTGGTDVTVTTAGSGVAIGKSVGKTDTDNPTGAVKVTETLATGKWTANTIVIDGGTTVDVIAKGLTTTVGGQGSAPSGAVTVTQSDVLTGRGYAAGQGKVTVDGGASVTINTTGGNVAVGAQIGGKYIVPTGAVSITDTFGGPGSDTFAVQGGSTVGITTTATSGAVSVGAAALPVLNNAIPNAAQSPTGNVTITNKTVAGATTVYGTGATNVYTNGGTTVNITGGAVQNIVDIQTTNNPATSKAVGASNLSSVVLEGNTRGAAGTIITSDALTNLTITKDTTKAGAYTVNNSAAHTLNLTVGGNAALSVTDATASTLAVGDNGTKSSGAQTLVAAKATTATFTNTAAQTFALTAANLTGITANNSGALTLGDVSGIAGLTSINAKGSTGGVTATINTAMTSFDHTAGSGNDTITILSNSLLKADGVTFTDILGGTGSNTLVANYVAAGADTALGNNAHIKNFSTLSLGTKASSATTNAAFKAATAATPEVHTITITAVDADGLATYTIDIGGGAVSHTDAGVGETVNAVAADLAAKLWAQNNAGYTITYGGANTFTITGPAAGTAFVPTVGGTTVNPIGDAVTTPGAAAFAGDNFYDASGFTALTVGATAGDVTFKNVGADTTLNITASTGGTSIINHLLANAAGKADTLGLTIGNAAAAATATLATTGIETVSITSGGKAANTLTIGDTAAKTINISGTKGLTLTLKTDALAGLTAAASNVTTINAANSTGTIDVTGVALDNQGGATHDTHTITGGAGTLKANGGIGVNNVDTITTGSGGGIIGIGKGGSWVAVAGAKANGAYAAGSETINLAASAAVVDTLEVTDGAVATYNGTAGGVNGFVTGVSKADMLKYTTAGKTVLANLAAPANVGTLTNAATTAAAIDVTGALIAKLANLTYTVANGVITFSATGGHQLSDFTSGELVSAAQIILNDTAAGAADRIAAFSTGGNTYVVTSDATQALRANAGVANTNLDSIINLRGLASTTGFGLTGAEGAIVVDSTTLTLVNSAVANTGTAAAAIYKQTGFGADTIDNTELGTTSTTITNFAPSAYLTLHNNGAAHNGAVSISQTGSAGNNSLTLNLTKAADVFKSITTSGDGLLVLNGNGGTITSLIDATNTVATLNVTGPQTVTGFTGTALKSVDTTAATGAVVLGAVATPFTSNDNVTFTLATGQNTTLVASGSTNTVTQGTGVGNVTLTANGASNTITLSNGANTVTANGTSTKITVGTGNNTITALGANATVSVGDDGAVDTITVGSNAKVAIGHLDNVVITGNFTGGTSAGYALTTLSLSETTSAYAGNTITFGNVATEGFLGGGAGNTGLVNVSSAATLAQALDLAANYAALTYQPGTDAAAGNGLLAANTAAFTWFQFSGDTYVVGAVNNTGVAVNQTGLDANDVVVKLTGLFDLNASAIAGGVLTL